MANSRADHFESYDKSPTEDFTIFELNAMENHATQARQNPPHRQGCQRIVLLDEEAQAELQRQYLPPPPCQQLPPQLEKPMEEVVPTPPSFIQQPYFHAVPEPDTLISWKNSNRALTIVLVLGVNYFLTCGGPSGVEVAVAAGGPLLAVIVLSVFPIVYSIPVAFVVSEMCTTFPDDGGFVIWGKNAFGNFWGFQQGFWAYVSGVLCNATYPISFYTALTSAYGNFTSPFTEYLIKLTIAVTFALPTLVSARFVSFMTLSLMVLELLPFVIFSTWNFVEAPDFDSLSEVRHVNTTTYDAQTQLSVITEEVSIDWKNLLSTAFWCYNGLFLVSLFGGQVRNPSYTYPRAVFGGLLFAVVSYIIPLLSAIAVQLIPWEDFGRTTYPDIAGILGGRFMKGFMVFAILCANCGLYGAATFACSYQLNGMGETGLLPEVFGRRHHFFETPYISLAAITLPVFFLLAFDMTTLLDVSNAFSAFVQITIILSAIRLRISHTEMYRPTKVPGGLGVFIFLMIIPLAVLGYMVFIAFKTYVTAIVFVAIFIVGFVYGGFVFVYLPRRRHQQSSMQ